MHTPGQFPTRLRSAGSRTPRAPSGCWPSFPGSQAVSSFSFTARPGDSPCNYAGQDAKASPALTGWGGAWGGRGPGQVPNPGAQAARGQTLRTEGALMVNVYPAPTRCPARHRPANLRPGPRLALRTAPTLWRAPAPGYVRSPAFTRRAACPSRWGRSLQVYPRPVAGWSFTRIFHTWEGIWVSASHVCPRRDDLIPAPVWHRFEGP